MALLYGEDLKSKQNTTKLARFKKVLFENLKDLKSHDAQLRKDGERRFLVETAPNSCFQLRSHDANANSTT